MVDASCFQARSVGAVGTVTGLGAGTSKGEAFARATDEVDGDVGAKETLVSAAVGKDNSELPFTAPPSVRKWKLE